MLEAGLVEPYDASIRDLSPGQRLAISFSGKAHLRLALDNDVFLEQMALTTAIVNEDVANQIRGTYFSNAAFNEKMRAIRMLFVRFVLEEDKNHMSMPYELEQYECQLILKKRLEHFIQETDHARDEADVLIRDEYQEGLVLEGIVATVDWFDAEKGFGFVDIEGVDGQVFLHAQQLQKKGIDHVSDGDDLICDVSRNAKGLHISHVHNIQTDPEEIETADCRVVRVFDDRGYGFVQIVDSSRDAFFHFSVVPIADREKLKIGTRIRAQIKTDKGGRGLQVKKVISFTDSVSQSPVST